MWAFGKRIAVGFALAFALLLVIGGVSYRSISALTDNSYWVAHTHEVLEHVTAALAAIKDIEAGARGFVITGDEAFLEPFRAGMQNLPRAMKDLRTLTADNPVQQKRM